MEANCERKFSNLAYYVCFSFLSKQNKKYFTQTDKHVSLEEEKSQWVLLSWLDQPLNC